jgi:pimeloyl-ACP methyl ester carboxylesterase
VLRGVTVVNGRRLEFAWMTPSNPRPGGPPLVFLHDGLGCLGMWADFAREVVRASGCGALVYSRAGHGQSDPASEPRRADFLHAEARSVLPALLSERGVDRPLLIGHREGAAIALIHAASGFDVAGVVAMAPPIRIEPSMLAAFEEAQRTYSSSDWSKRLGKFHRDADATFRGWASTWLKPELRSWSIEALLPSVRAPVVLVQGEDDAYATIEQALAVARTVARPVDSIELQGVGHAPWKDAPHVVVDAIGALVDRIAPPR